MDSRFGTVASVLGYATLTIGIALILHPAARDVVAAGVLGALVGVLRRLGRGRRTIEALMPFLAAFCVAALTALLVEHDVTDPGLRAMIASLVVFIPGVALTTAFLELTEGQMIAGSSRLVWGSAQLGLLAFGIVAGIAAVGVPPGAGVLELGRGPRVVGAMARRARLRDRRDGRALGASGAFVSLLVVLYAAWTGQVVGNALFGG